MKNLPSGVLAGLRDTSETLKLGEAAYGIESGVIVRKNTMKNVKNKFTLIGITDLIVTP